MKRKPQKTPAHLKAGVCLGYLFAAIFAIGIASGEGKTAWAGQGQPGQVVLWKAAQPVIEVATLTPGCQTHDWGCVLGEARQ